MNTAEVILQAIAEERLECLAACEAEFKKWRHSDGGDGYDAIQKCISAIKKRGPAETL